MTEEIRKALNVMIDTANALKTAIDADEMKNNWKKDLTTMMAENRTDTMAVFEKYGNFKDEKLEAEKEYCKTRIMCSLENFFEEPWEAKCLDDAMNHLSRFIELTRR